MITYNTDGVAMPKLKKRIINRWIKQVAATYGRKVGDIGYMFVDDAKILQVNNEYLGHDYYTDIITFDYDEDDIVSGDLVISIDTVKSNAELFGKEYEDEDALYFEDGVYVAFPIIEKDSDYYNPDPNEWCDIYDERNPEVWYHMPR